VINNSPFGAIRQTLFVPFEHKKSAQWRILPIDYPNGKAVLSISTDESLPGLVQFTM